MKKNIVQDVIPPKRTIRNVELLYKTKRPDRGSVSGLEDDKFANAVSTPKRVIAPLHKTQPEETPLRFEYEEPVKSSKKVLYISLGIFIIALVFGISALFKSAKITITPKNETGLLDTSFKANKDAAGGVLGFQIVTTSKDVEKTVPATTEQYVEKKASGTIVVYNNFSSEPQKLVATTRFETPEGLIFRAKEAVTIPGIQTKDGKSVAGSAEVAVEADQPGSSYNVGLKDFTIVGFKGTSKYEKIYARSKTEMFGGFKGNQKGLSKEIIIQAEKELEDLLKISLSNEILSQIPEHFVLYKNSVSYKLEPVSQIDTLLADTSTSTTILKKKGSISAIIFDKGALSKAIISKILPGSVDDVVKISNLDSLEFSFLPETQFNHDSSTLLNFNLKGSVNFVWVVDENKLKADLLGLSKNNAITIMSAYPTIKEAKIETYPFWNGTIPKDSKDVILINTLAE